MRTLIDFDPAKGKFYISCPRYDNNRVRSLPNRRWNKSGSNWIVPAVRANVEAMRELFKNATWSVRAREKLDGYTAELKAMRKPKGSGMPSWYGFKRKPRPKQAEALEKVHGLDVYALFMDMRTGKTKVFIDDMCARRMEGRIQAVLLICPLSCRRNWMNEYDIDGTIPADMYKLNTDKPKEFDKWLGKKHDFKWLLVGSESLSQGSAIKYVERFLTAFTKVFSGVDESSKIKTHNAAITLNCVDKIRPKCEGRAILSGRPMTKNPLDLFSQFEYLDPQIIGMGDYYSFKCRYAVFGGFDEREIIGYDNLEELAQLVEPFTVQVRQDEVFQSEKVPVLREVQMTKEQQDLYKSMKRKSSLKYEGGSIDVQNVLEKMLRLQEIAGGHVSLEHTEEALMALRQRMGPKAKLPRTYRVPIGTKNPKVQDVIACAEEYEGSMIVWCAWENEWLAVAAALREKYGEDQVVEIHGGIDEDARHESIEGRFKTKKARFAVGNPTCGGIGLTLSVADTIVFFSGTFNFETRSQAEERGTAPNKSTLIVDIVAPGTVDEVVLAAHREKLDVTEYVRRLIEQMRARGEAIDVDALTAAASV